MDKEKKELLEELLKQIGRMNRAMELYSQQMTIIIGMQIEELEEDMDIEHPGGPIGPMYN